MPPAAVTSAGWLIVRSGSTTAIVGRSPGWLMPVFTCSDQHVQHADRRALAAGPGRRRHRDERQQRLGRRPAAADRGVDVVEQLPRVGGEQVDRLGGVDRRPAADRHDASNGPASRGNAMAAAALVRRLDVHPVEHDDLDAVVTQPVRDPSRLPGRGHAGIGDEDHPASHPARARS